MNAPVVSVVVPTHNGARFLAEAIGSVLAQSGPSIEVIVVDDGSQDGSARIAAAFGDPVRVVGQPRGGVASARNRGITSARGAFVAFLDHDDVWAPDKLERQMAAFAARASLEVCVGHIQRFRGAWSGPDMELIGDPVPGFVTVTMLVRREAFDRVGLFNPLLEHSDTAEWLLRGEGIGLAVHLLPDVLTYHRSHETNTSLLSADRSRREFLRLAKARINWWRSGAGRDRVASPDPDGADTGRR